MHFFQNSNGELESSKAQHLFEMENISLTLNQFIVSLQNKRFNLFKKELNK